MKRAVILFVLACSVFAAAISWAGSEVSEGEEAFEVNGCTGCHKVGSDWNGPDLTMVTTYRSKEWLIDFILNTKKHFEDPVVKGMIEKFNMYMPDQGVEPEDAEHIYNYLKSLPNAAGKEEDKAGE